MNFAEWSQEARDRIHPQSDLVSRHLDYMKEFVRIDSRSFNVNEFEGDRTEPSDMREILDLAKKYLLEIGFGKHSRRRNQPQKKMKPRYSSQPTLGSKSESKT